MVAAQPVVDWTARERGLIHGLNLERLGPLPPDPSNRFADDPKAAAFGKTLFNDTRLSANGKVSCATCHRDDYHTTDDVPVGVGIGPTTRRTMPLEGIAHQTWFFWDGRKDSLWAQALEPIVNPVEHGLDPTGFAARIRRFHGGGYRRAIGELPSDDVEILVDCGKAIAAFVRTLQPGPSAFDHYAAALAKGDPKGGGHLNDDQQQGLRLFLSKAKCINCHNGPLFSNGEFHHVGVPDAGESDPGRAVIFDELLSDEFNQRGVWSDADPETEADHLAFLNTDTNLMHRAFKTPSLRNVAQRPPYMHAGQFSTLAELLVHYRAVSGKNGVDEIFHGDVSDEELRQLEAFLRSLNAKPE